MGEIVDCAYTVEGDGPALVLIHGIGAARDAWRFVTPRLTSEFSCISYDLRGHGESPLPAGKFSLHDLVDDLEALCTRLDIDEAHFAGHSLGGMIGPAYARRHPHRVLSLGLLSTAAGRSDDDRNKLTGVLDQMNQRGIAATLEVLVERWFTAEFAVSHPELIERRLKQVLDTDPEVFLNVFRIYAETEMAPWLNEIQAPALVLTGENDLGCSPRLNRLIASELSDAELVVLPHLKHSILVEAPAEVAGHIKRFILGRF